VFATPTPSLGVVAYLTLMTVEATSAGAILFRDTRGEREYLLLKSRPGTGSSQGRDRGGRGAPADGDQGRESEEAGIEDFRLIDGFRKEYDYVFEANGGTPSTRRCTCSSRARSKRAPKSRTNTVTCSGATTIRRSTRSRKQAPRDLRGRPRLPRRAERRGHRRVRLSGYSRSIPPRSLLNCRRLPQP